MLSAIVLLAVLPATFAKFAIPIEKVSETMHTASWDITYRMANLAGPIAICDNPNINAQPSGTITQEIANASAPEAQLNTPEYTAKGFWYWVNSSGWDADAVSADMGNFVFEMGSTFSDITTDLAVPVYGCSVEPYCEFADSNPCGQQGSPAYCTLFVCMFTSYSSDAGRSRAAKARRDANFLPLVDGLPAPAPKSKALSLRDTYPRNATAYYNYLAQPNVRLQLAGNKDQEDIARLIMDHMQCDAFLDPKANMENIPWDTVPTYKERNIDLMRRRSQLKPIFERVFVIDETEMSEEEKPVYREDTVVRLLQSVHRYANFVKMRFERVGCAYIPQCASTNTQEFPLAVMVCVTVQPYSGPTPPPVKRTTPTQATAAATGTQVPQAGASVDATTVAAALPSATETETVAAQPVTELVTPAAELTESELELDPEVDPSLVEDMTNQKVKI